MRPLILLDLYLELTSVDKATHLEYNAIIYLDSDVVLWDNIIPLLQRKYTVKNNMSEIISLQDIVFQDDCFLLEGRISKCDKWSVVCSCFMYIPLQCESISHATNSFGLVFPHDCIYETGSRFETSHRTESLHMESKDMKRFPKSNVKKERYSRDS